eukprot:TRINITY_DN11181_c0_g3_i1.p1 TRINITY_DN11181_c0_g3~~TRINITY_DN11181_c0_g3_i1.p1  ORF type:complete len:153 (+),score=22.09 TRINITY_DN11181_c0_g3_i1:83-541(+)
MCIRDRYNIRHDDFLFNENVRTGNEEELENATHPLNNYNTDIEEECLIGDGDYYDSRHENPLPEESARVINEEEQENAHIESAAHNLDEDENVPNSLLTYYQLIADAYWNSLDISYPDEDEDANEYMHDIYRESSNESTQDEYSSPERDRLE